MKSMSQKLVLLGCVVSAALVTSSRATARVSSACDVSGAYTERLCPLDHMLSGTYLYSANEAYRFYYANGTSKIYDVSDWDNWVEVCSVLQPHANPGYLMYAPSDPSPLPTMSLQAFNSSNVVVAGFGQAGEPDGEHFIQLDNDGALRIYDQGGSRTILTVACL